MTRALAPVLRPLLLGLGCAAACGGQQISSWSPSGSLEWEDPEPPETEDAGADGATTPDGRTTTWPGPDAAQVQADLAGPPATADAAGTLESADRAFTDGNLPAAIQLYGVAFATGTRAEQVYALYKLGWCEMNLGRAPEASARLEQLLALADPPLDDAERRLRDDAIRDLATFAASRTDLSTPQLLDRLARSLDGAELRRALETLADTYRASGRLEAEAVVRGRLQQVE